MEKKGGKWVTLAQLNSKGVGGQGSSVPSLILSGKSVHVSNIHAGLVLSPTPAQG